MSPLENAVLNAIATLLVDGDYQYRTVKAIAEKAGVAPGVNISRLAEQNGFSCDKTRRRDDAQLIGFGGNSREEVECLADISKALMDPRYTMRTPKGAAPSFDPAFVLAVASNFGYDVDMAKCDATPLICLGG